MKNLVACLFSLASSAALAGPIPTQNPTVKSLTGAFCGTNPMQSITTGFSADGNYLQSVAKGYTFCQGHGGYYYWCFQLQFDLAGNFTGATGVGGAYSRATFAAYAKCPDENPNLTFSSAAGYLASTQGVPHPYGYIFYFPALDAP